MLITVLNAMNIPNVFHNQIEENIELSQQEQTLQEKLYKNIMTHNTK